MVQTDMDLIAAREEAKHWECEALDLMEENAELKLEIQEYKDQIKELTIRLGVGREEVSKTGRTIVKRVQEARSRDSR